MSDKAIDAALDVMLRHVEALNARDPEGVAKTLHFPHFRLSGDTVKIWENHQNYMDDFHQRAGENWGHTEWGHLKPVQSSSKKVHIDVLVQRFDRSSVPIVSFRSLWVVTEIDGVWGAQFRSSFAQDPN
ncbi:hypothetical protein J7426_01710 [Tropicibacter sp. R16_0]|uniref:hypothetical protein n=1 Tax=Tropicibacter sp. R16_0 TaxID=2821102 RepID=UPI001ADBA1A3|nr:hypothetical protein [Tropicibacter sp. R16_0]MBO9448954.1 hypothetical protein [Tropicibacter sp. R16_0]